MQTYPECQNYGWQDNRPRSNLALSRTDVHQGKKTIWIEPQWSSAQGAVGVDLDSNGDGKVTYATAAGTQGTDGYKRIEVYKSREDALKHRKLD